MSLDPEKRASLLLWRPVAVLLLSATLASAFAGPNPGLYYDPQHDGHGFDLQPVGQQWVMVLYSYDANGQPEWLLGVADEDAEGRIAGELSRFDYDAARVPPQQSTGVAGSYVLEPAKTCAGLRFDWVLDEAAGSWCVQPLLDAGAAASQDFTGLWYAGEADRGWGLTLGFQGEPAPAEVQVLFYYDSARQPRWALGVAGQPGADSITKLHNFVGYCRSCEPLPLTSVEAGTIEHSLSVVDGLPGGRIDVDVAYTLDPGGGWQREDSPLTLLSDPALGLIPLPSQVEPEKTLAFVDVSVLPLTEEGVLLEHQTLVVTDGVIAALGDRAAVPIPADAVRIDGRGLYLGPGLSDMHTHFTFGGVVAMREAGTLFIANGVTTVLNMGDGGTQNLPGMDEQFGSGAFIGPAVYAGQAAYGPGDGRAASLTVATPSGATAYAERLSREGYDFIKLYNSLAPEVVQQFMTDGERLGLPVIGHLPKTITMQRALESGQRMIAHVAEVYFTLLGNQPREDLLQTAADLIKQHGVYLTDTLTASESFAMLFGGNEQNFEAFARREGVLYQPTSFVGAWRNFFESATLQPAGSQPGQLDARLVFFKQMVKFFSDQDVPIILGTDSPGHTGVISGFSVHENLRLYAEIGMSPFQAYAAASRNPGRFFDDTLAPAISFGTLELGKRADLLLLEADPLADVVNLKRPLGVMSRGRFWSRDFLAAELARLDAKYPDPVVADRR